MRGKREQRLQQNPAIVCASALGVDCGDKTIGENTLATKINVWDNPKKELKERLDAAKKARRDAEARWEIIDSTFYKVSARQGQSAVMPSSGGSVVSTGHTEDVDNTPSEVAVLYASKNLRFIHSQLSTNAPTVSVKPSSSDADDIRRTNAGNRLTRHALRKYSLQEVYDIRNNDTLHYGSGFLKTKWNPELGEILYCDEEGSLKMEGDFEIEVVSPKRMYVDADANYWKNVRYVFERKVMPYEAACHLLSKFLDEEKLRALEQFRKKNYTDEAGTEKHDVVILYEYWETGLPYNGYAGRFCICAEDGTLFTPILPNPHAFGKPTTTKQRKGLEPKPTHKKARLPYHMLTDIDNPDSVWGLTFLDFVIRAQDVLNRLDSVMLDNLEVHAVDRIILPESCDIAAESLTNSPKEIIKITGNQPPYYMNPPQMTPDLSRTREMLKIGIDELSGVNDSMFGIIGRETAGTAMQYSVNQGSQIRKRLFNKLAIDTENVYRDYLDIIRENWDVERTIMVLGKENALEAVDIKGADIDGGFDIVVEYGTTLPIDPMTRRQEIINYMPFFKEAGVPPKSLLPLMRLNDLDGYFDEVERAKNRQREYFEEMTATKQYIAPQLFEDHENMLIFCKEYIMTQEFKQLDVLAKTNIRKHLIERAGMPAEEAKLLQGAGAPAQPAAPAPMPGQVVPGMPPEAAPVGALPPLGL
jgi:hypothetical protein